MTVALYPGTFDPVTNGHIDIMSRAAYLFEQLIVGVFYAPPKNLMFTTEERVDMVKKATADIPNVRVEAYRELTVNYAKSIGAKVIVRGLRMGSDFEREFDMALMNRKLAVDIETICLMSSAEHQFISSSLLKEVAQGLGCVSGFVPEHVAVALTNKYKRE